jgi:signal transduction histidine kinase
VKSSVALAIVAGAAGVVLLAAAFRIPLADALALVAIGGGTAIGVAAIGAFAVASSRRRPIATQTTVVVLTSVIAVALGAVVAGFAGLVGWKDAEGVLVVAVVAGAAGALVAQVLGRTVGAASWSLRTAVRGIGGGHAGPHIAEPATEELASLARDLNAMSRRLDESRAREQASEDARTQLVAWISHDLRVPLSRIRAIAEALEDRVLEDGEANPDYVRALRLESERLTGLVDELFEPSRIEAGVLNLRLERTMLVDVVSDAIAAADVHARKQDVRLDASVPDANPQVHISVSHIARALHNLLENAIRHTPMGGVVRVELETSNGQAIVSVADMCGGIVEQELQQLLDRQALSPRADNGRTGFGLAIARGIVEAHGGRIWVENTGIGCRFLLSLPTARPAPTSPVG